MFSEVKTVPQTVLFGTFPIPCFLSICSTGNGVPKAVPKSMFQNFADLLTFSTIRPLPNSAPVIRDQGQYKNSLLFFWKARRSK